MRRPISGCLLAVALMGLGACDAANSSPSSRATILKHDPATVHASTKPTTQRAEWAPFEYRTFLDGHGGRMPFRILYPENYDPSAGRVYPLVLFLHGAGERGTDNERQLIHGSDLFLKTRTDFPAIVVFPQCPPESWWGEEPDIFFQSREEHVNDPYPDLKPQPTREIQLLHDLVVKLQGEERIDPSRRYIMGLSMGGMGTFEMIERYPELFAAAIPMCGGGAVSATRKYKREVALWITHGDADNVVPVEWSRAVVKALQVQDRPPRYTEFAGVNHDAWTPTVAMPELLPWLFSQKKVIRGR